MIRRGAWDENEPPGLRRLRRESEVPVPGGLLTALAALVAYSRVHTGVHYPSDVVVGAVIGAALSPIAVSAAERYRATPSASAPAATA